MVSVSPVSDAPLKAASPHRAVAPAWHTAVVVLALLGLSFWGARAGDLSPHGRARIYLVTMLIEWALLAFLWFGLNRRGVRLADLIGGSWPRSSAFFRDLGIGTVFVLTCGGAVLQGLTHLLKVVPPASMRAVMPQTLMDMVVWVLLSCTAGFCEEVIFRGYLARQFSALTQSAAAGIVLQGVVFGLGHGYQGWKLMLIISIYGMLFGVLAHWRRNLRPGMLAHALQDTAGGLLYRFLG